MFSWAQKYIIISIYLYFKKSQILGYYSANDVDHGALNPP
jgi:hypothetical protein